MKKSNQKKIKEQILKSAATPFQKEVWLVLLEIPRGEVRSYSWVAEKIGRPKAVRAVGNALNKNPFAPDVPCHRVIKKDGSLGGFAKGPGQKRILLNKEIRRGSKF